MQSSAKKEVTMTTGNELRRSTTDRIIGGVCGGLARYFQIDTGLLRVGWVLLFLLAGTGGLIYLVLWGILPDDAGQRSSLPWVLLVLLVGLPLLCALVAIPFGLFGALFHAR
jgi:phage shock protein PspC (stress-responsive transcriptional regulator)